MTFPLQRLRYFPLFLLAVGLLATAPAPVRAGAPMIGLDEIRPGMTGYGLTVFAGTRVDTFGVTVVGVQENTRADGSIILVEVSGHGLETSSIAQGMSGSPIFLDGRLAGALAFGWSGALRPLAGVTPAGELLAISTDPPADPMGAAAGLPTATWEPLLSAIPGTLGTALGYGDATPAPVAPDAQDVRMAYGWPEPALLATELLKPFMPTDHAAAWICRPAGRAGTGSAQADMPPALVPGAACAVPLVLGDARLGAIGTVTWVDGDDVHMMGHPFMQRGGVRWPLASAEILTLFPSRQMSFKMGSIGEVVGAVHQDRRAGIAGRLGAEAPLLPVTVTTPGGTYRFEVANDPQLAPTLVFWTVYNALLATGDDASDQTIRWRMTTRWRADGEAAPSTLELAGASAGPGGVAALGPGMMAPLAILLRNPFVAVGLERIDVTLDTADGVASANVRGMTAPLEIVAGTHTLEVTVDLEPRRGEPASRTLTLDLPAGLRPGRHRLVAANAAEFFALEAQRAGGIFQAGDLGATVELLATERGVDNLVVALLARGEGVVVRGRELAGLPGSIARTVRRSASRTQRTAADFVARTEESTPWLLQGHAVLDVRVILAAVPLEPERRP